METTSKRPSAISRYVVVGALVGLAALALLRGSSPTGSQLLFAGACVVGVVVAHLYSSGSSPHFKAAWSESGATAEVIPTVAVGRPKRAEVHVSATIVPQEERGEHEQEIDFVSSRLYEHLERSDYKGALEYLDERRAVVDASWRLTANYARCLELLGYYDRAREWAESLLQRFSDEPEAVASAYELLSLCVFARTPTEPGLLRDTLVSERQDLIDKGLKASPNRTALLLNKAETSSLQGDDQLAWKSLFAAALSNPEAARVGIRRLVSADGELGRALLSDEHGRWMLEELGVDLHEEE